MAGMKYSQRCYEIGIRFEINYVSCLPLNLHTLIIMEMEMVILHYISYNEQLRVLKVNKYPLTGLIAQLQAMKIVNKVKLREEVDYEALCHKLENQVDLLTAEVERQRKLRDNEKHQLENQLKDCQEALIEMEKSLLTRSEVVVSSSSGLKIVCTLSSCQILKVMILHSLLYLKFLLKSVSL